MPKFIVLLRGVNVGKGNRVSMAEFKQILESLGHSEVRTLLNSGNAVCQCQSKSSAPLASAVHAAIQAQLGLDVAVVVKSARELQAIIQGNALADECDDPSRLLVAFAQDAKTLRGLEQLAALAQPPDRFVLGNEAAYLLCVQGILESPAGKALLGKVGKSVTTRNWATVLKLQGLLE